jgi:tight adherence protein B
LFYESILPAILLFPLWFLYMKEWMEEKAIGKEQEFSSLIAWKNKEPS